MLTTQTMYRTLLHMDRTQSQSVLLVVHCASSSPIKYKAVISPHQAHREFCRALLHPFPALTAQVLQNRRHCGKGVLPSVLARWRAGLRRRCPRSPEGGAALGLLAEGQGRDHPVQENARKRTKCRHEDEWRHVSLARSRCCISTTIAEGGSVSLAERGYVAPSAISTYNTNCSCVQRYRD